MHVRWRRHRHHLLPLQLLRQRDELPRGDGGLGMRGSTRLTLPRRAAQRRASVREKTELFLRRALRRRHHGMQREDLVGSRGRLRELMLARVTSCT